MESFVWNGIIGFILEVTAANRQVQVPLPEPRLACSPVAGLRDLLLVLNPTGSAEETARKEGS
jgi:hypothetical protein